MCKRWGLYLGALVGALGLFFYFKNWVSWMILLWICGLPLVSLLVSLPAMIRIRFQFTCPERVLCGETVRPQLKMQCKFPLPPVRCRIRVALPMTLEVYLYELGENLVTDHCGMREIRIHTLRVYDYLGLFFRPVRWLPEYQLAVEPPPVAMAEVPRVEGVPGASLRPKQGFSEHHELRPYREGDDLRGIHWKLSAKVGSLVYREPMEVTQGKMFLSLVLGGEPGVVDRTLGRALWAGQSLLDRGYGFTLRALGNDGLREYPVTDAQSLTKALHSMLSTPLTEENARLPEATEGAWELQLGGGGHAE